MASIEGLQEVENELISIEVIPAEEERSNPDVGKEGEVTNVLVTDDRSDHAEQDGDVERGEMTSSSPSLSSSSSTLKVPSWVEERMVKRMGGKKPPPIFDWNAFSRLMESLMMFGAAQLLTHRDSFQVRVGERCFCPAGLKGTVYEREVQLTWKAEDMTQEALEKGGSSQDHPELRSHLRLLEQHFRAFRLRVFPRWGQWTVYLSFPLPGTKPRMDVVDKRVFKKWD